MKIRSWLLMCSSTTCTATATSAEVTVPKSLISDTSGSSSDFQTHSSSSLQSNLSLLTLPSLPSLQKLTLSPQTAAANSAVLLTSFTTNRRGHIHFLAVHNNLLYAASGNEINVFDITDNSLFDTFNVARSHTGSVKSIAFREGKIFTAHQDCKIRIWYLNERNQHKLVATLPTLEDRLTRFILPRNYVNVRRHRKKLWIEHNDAVSGLAEHENFVLSVSWDRSIKIWKTRDFRCQESVTKAHDDAINAIAISNDGIIYTGSADKRVKVWKREETNKKYDLLATLEKHKSAVNALALSRTGSVLFSGSCDRSILVWEREDSANHMAVIGALRGHARAILCLINVQDLLLSGSADRTVRIWQRGFDGRYCCLTVLDGHLTPVRSLAAEETADGSGVKVFSGSFDGDIRVWRVEVLGFKE